MAWYIGYIASCFVSVCSEAIETCVEFLSFLCLSQFVKLFSEPHLAILQRLPRSVSCFLL